MGSAEGRGGIASRLGITMAGAALGSLESTIRRDYVSTNGSRDETLAESRKHGTTETVATVSAPPAFESKRIG